MNGLIEGKKYVLSTPVDTVITDVKYNIPLGTVKAGQQYVFQAVSDAVTVADGCTIRPFEGSNGASVGVVGGSGESADGDSGKITFEYEFANNGTYSVTGKNLGNLTNGNQLFNSSSPLTSFTGDLSNLETGEKMFQQTSLTSFTSDLSSLTNGTYMFSSCTKLKTFISSLSSLTNGERMFFSCRELTTFNSDLSSLTNSTNIFGNASNNCTKLDLASVQNIADTINDLASKGKTGTLNIGMAKALQSDDETAPINVALAAIRAKGWTVTEIYKS